MEQEPIRPYQPTPLKKSKEEEDGNEWLITYADAMTLILGFFVLILSMSIINQSKFADVSEAIAQGLLKKEVPLIESPFKALNTRLRNTLIEYDILPEQALMQEKDSLKIDLPGHILFATGSSQLQPSSQRLIADLARDIRAFDLQDFSIEIEGHTDDIPIQTERYPSNWELSSSRAIQVLQVFLEQGVDGNKLKAIGYAQTRPKVPNREANGQALPDNQQLNRRVEIKIARNL